MYEGDGGVTRRDPLSLGLPIDLMFSTVLKPILGIEGLDENGKDAGIEKVKDDNTVKVQDSLLGLLDK